MQDQKQENGAMNTELTAARAGEGQNLSIFGSTTPEGTIAFATRLATALKPVIEQQGMFSLIQGRKYVKAEGWLTLGAMLGILPRETKVTELRDGSFEAHVDLVSMAQGKTVGGASALCGIEESRWAKADRYARRSMAVTRATVKAYRIAFSWIIQLAGYQVTPAEEIPQENEPTPRYSHADQECRDWLKVKLEKAVVPRDQWDIFSRAYDKQYMTDLGFEVTLAQFKNSAKAHADS